MAGFLSSQLGWNDYFFFLWKDYGLHNKFLNDYCFEWSKPVMEQTCTSFECIKLNAVLEKITIVIVAILN